MAIKTNDSAKQNKLLAQTEKSMYDIIHHSFGEMFRLAQKNRDITIKEVKGEFIDDNKFRSIMFTVSSSNFRLVILLHFLPKAELPKVQSDYFSNEIALNEQQYLDYKVLVDKMELQVEEDID